MVMRTAAARMMAEIAAVAAGIVSAFCGGRASMAARGLAAAAALGFAGGASAEVAEKILDMPTICTNGGCLPGGVLFTRGDQAAGATRGRVDFIQLQASWSADVAVYCDLNGADEVVFSIEPPVRPSDRIWVKSAGEAVFVGFTSASGRIEERVYGAPDIDAALRAGFDARGRSRLPFSASAETLVWTARAVRSRVCA